MFDGISEHQLTPPPDLRSAGDFQRRAQPLLQMLVAIHPAGYFRQRRPVPATDNHSHQRARKRSQRRRRHGPGRYRQQMPDADRHQQQHSPDQQAAPQPPQRPRPAPPPGRLLQGRLDDLQFAHGLGQTCNTRAPLARHKALDKATAKKFLENRVRPERLGPGACRAAVELSAFSNALVASPSPPREERAGERRPIAPAPLDPMAVGAYRAACLARGGVGAGAGRRQAKSAPARAHHPKAGITPPAKPVGRKGKKNPSVEDQSRTNRGPIEDQSRVSPGLLACATLPGPPVPAAQGSLRVASG